MIEVSDQSAPLLINEGHSLRYDDLADIDVVEASGRPLINIFRSTPKPLPLILRTMERHPLSSQTFIPLGDQPYLVVVARAGEFDINAIEVFLAGNRQGVNYHRGTWHHYSLALNKICDFLVIDRGGEGENCDEITLEYALEIVLEGVDNE